MLNLRILGPQRGSMVEPYSVSAEPHEPADVADVQEGSTVEVGAEFEAFDAPG